MARAGRPRRPSYRSVTKVLDAIRSCSCGRFESWEAFRRNYLLKDYLKYKFECNCIGPKLRSQLLTLTKLHPDTLSRTCKFLCSQGVLRRRMLPRRGHYVEYSISDAYRNDQSLRSEIEYSVKERRRAARSLSYLFRQARLIGKVHNRFAQAHRATIDLVDARWRANEHLSTPNYMYLVRLVEALGPEEGLRVFVDRYRRLGSRRFGIFAGRASYNKRDVAAFSAINRLADRSMKDIVVTSKD